MVGTIRGFGMRKFFFEFWGLGWRGVGLNVVGMVLRDRGIENCGRESLSVLFGRTGRTCRTCRRGGGRWFVRIFFVDLEFFCIFVAWYFVFIPYFVLKLK